jgi:hypothetical protein
MALIKYSTLRKAKEIMEKIAVVDNSLATLDGCDSNYAKSGKKKNHTYTVSVMYDGTFNGGYIYLESSFIREALNAQKEALKKQLADLDVEIDE